MSIIEQRSNELFRLEPLGDQGALARCESEEEALRFAATLRRTAPPWLLDIVQAYTTVAVFHDFQQISVREVIDELSRLALGSQEITPGTLHRLPCCYELGPDLDRVAQTVGLDPEEVIRFHGSVQYTIYAIGFTPGFPYLGYLPAALCGVPRLPAPRLCVEPGSVGLTGRQTGIYPEARPGGWNLIGRTPLTLVEVTSSYFPLRTGDRVQFERIDTAEFEQLLGKWLS